MAEKKKLGTGRHYSALKRNRQNEKRNERNKSARSALRTVLKKARQLLQGETLKPALASLDKAAGKGLIPKKRAARLKSRLQKAVNKAAA
ncbi:MAG: 30S ribosomal protein S20 [Deltaproteobacteria bacterium CG_4_10_14_0_2_um_filter_43_8]|nr:MAG: 30S ribosomal protein S20 [Deltaproteobacteria bacterium CG11_big_fil_rev_8_21_14_0_20_42_23]PJA20625.1 MAG: 30S ribosomal protein S20 [Deltaproteobacteria bacterium CG_4_10_14_0_2_um_filter_43_8]PJC65218.1 MAG: 30S ribosomal protein S20 [Deltaproteobacteria bacterium CG_4_9_14_0_2_um_filter_42_21]